MWRLASAGAGGYLEMNVYKPLIIFNLAHSITIITDGCTNFRRFLVEGTKPNRKKIKEYVDRSLMLVTCTGTADRIRQGIENRAPRDGQRSHVEAGRTATGFRDGG